MNSLVLDVHAIDIIANNANKETNKYEGRMIFIISVVLRE